MTMTDSPIDNGVNVEALLGACEAMTGTPAAAAFTWRAGSEWVNGTHTRTPRAPGNARTRTELTLLDSWREIQQRENPTGQGRQLSERQTLVATGQV